MDSSRVAHGNQDIPLAFAVLARKGEKTEQTCELTILSPQSFSGLGPSRADASKPLRFDRIMAGQNHKAKYSAKPKTPVCLVLMILPGHDSVSSEGLAADFPGFRCVCPGDRVLCLEIQLARSLTWIMSVAELKRAVDDLTPDERLELADYLRRRSKQDDPRWEAELGKRLDRCLEGKGHPAEELLALHERLSSEGR
jgi:hypothetical protein